MLEEKSGHCGGYQVLEILLKSIYFLKNKYDERNLIVSVSNKCQDDNEQHSENLVKIEHAQLEVSVDMVDI